MAAALWAPRLFKHCDSMEAGRESPLFKLMAEWTGPESILSILLGFFLMLFTAVLFNYFMVKHELLPKNSLIGGMVFVILMSHPLSTLGMNPVMASALIIVLSFERILNSYGKPHPAQDSCSAAFLAALALLLYFPSAILFILLLLSFMLFGNFTLRSVLVSLTGIVAVYLYLLVLYFLYDDLEGQYAIYVDWVSNVPGIVMPPSGPVYAVYGMVLLLAAAGLMYVFSHINEWNVSIRKKTMIGIWFAILSLATLLYEGDNISSALALVMIPFSLIIAAFLAGRTRRSIWMEIFVWMLFLGSLLNNIFFSPC